jgi:hypothetical protein
MTQGWCNPTSYAGKSSCSFGRALHVGSVAGLAQIEESGNAAVRAGGRGRLVSMTEALSHEDRLRRAKWLGALADRLFRNECARLGIDAHEAINSPLLSIIARRGYGASAEPKKK